MTKHLMKKSIVKNNRLLFNGQENVLAAFKNDIFSMSNQGPRVKM